MPSARGVAYCEREHDRSTANPVRVGYSECVDSCRFQGGIGPSSGLMSVGAYDLSYRTLTDTHRHPQEWIRLGRRSASLHLAMDVNSHHASQPCAPEGTARSVASRGKPVDVIARQAARDATRHHVALPAWPSALRPVPSAGCRSLAVARLMCCRALFSSRTPGVKTAGRFYGLNTEVASA
ncbi:hypothetical protein BU23DRAFT_564356 [Bimuria novae-zelandiae CBS 107.79]|uniref:Uncharacterized protein n=1 Tax=Bimuria novae-zelandiae CBS 107.79 TaxID=1447943 RepID=A0A6A5VY41_9PLEO|nr:hypothetical protein BU23DRAFT_564356 [Bimuria novae-zelandiae CBS 107.79]